ncbi:M15 family metallopeptidase [Cohnella lubricantis]|uniref:M15 family metallopeptidase n=1 Tax=Cohnella lubricantis TaxID=2163172 RepID=A0A841TI72_9BACL|nr:M15 family metallopeptidase [Cohnella lubricantis]MBB6678938.1 M15 family metallopeptidase [Cohnella lubricantis]MBP2118844.1 D-alanyl-D-alanine carboxypeptidase [Cohnella lubricantis]
MKKWVILLALLLGLLLWIGDRNLNRTPGTEVQINRVETDEIAETAAADTKDTTNAPDAPAGNDSSVRTIQVTPDQIYKGDLVLVNQDHPVHAEGMLSDIAELSRHPELTEGYGLLDNKIQLSERVAKQFSAMVAAAGEDGVNHFLISSGYRDNEKQAELYEEEGPDYALPAGFSEHNLGLSLDIGSSLEAMERAPEGKWLTANAWDYGFILRYPKDKTAITGIQYEPWHFRYVGLPHSQIMKEKRFTLEEYLSYLREQKQIQATIDGRTYDISYIPVTGETAIEVPTDRDYEISGNNVDGVILTVYPQ